jgi:hypothetical protein
MDNDLKEYLILAMDDWQRQLEQIETHYDDSEMVDNQAAKERLLQELVDTRSKLERMRSQEVEE